MPLCALILECSLAQIAPGWFLYVYNILNAVGGNNWHVINLFGNTILFFQEKPHKTASKNNSFGMPWRLNHLKCLVYPEGSELFAMKPWEGGLLHPQRCDPEAESEI